VTNGRRFFHEHQRGLQILALTVLPACVPLQPVPSARVDPWPRASAVTYEHIIRFPTDSVEITPAEASRMQAFLSALPADRRISVRVAGHADSRASEAYNLRLSDRRAQRVAELVKASGLVDIEVSTLALGEASPSGRRVGEEAWPYDRRVEVLVSAYEVVLPGCPDWSRDPAFDPRNLPLSNLGCANAVNLGLMVADPADLERGRPLGPADAVRESEAIVRYRTDKVKELDAEILQ
jgi:pilus assembly protein CpaD